jgi:hypothetical protein
VGVAAVFSYTIPLAASHFRVNYCCVPANRLDERSVSETPAYHGSIYVDAASGTILRIVIQADLRKSDPIRRAAMLIDYAPVKLGEHIHYTPSRSIAVLDAHTLVSDGEDLVRHLNRSTFTNYRRFGSEMRMVP